MNGPEIPGFIDAGTLAELERHGWAVVPRDCVLPAARHLMLAPDQLGHLRRVMMRDILRAAAEVVGVEARDLPGHRRDTDIVEARHAAAWVADRHFAIGRMQIAAALRRDVSSVDHGIASVELRLSPDRPGRDRHVDMVRAVRRRALEIAGAPIRTRLGAAV